MRGDGSLVGASRALIALTRPRLLGMIRSARSWSAQARAGPDGPALGPLGALGCRLGSPRCDRVPSGATFLRMELRHLRYFVAVAEELHFRRAAERLHVAQPAVSEQVRKLEAELGVLLLNRTHRSVSLTDAGAAMLVEARRVLRQAEVAERVAKETARQAAGRLRMGYPLDSMPPALSR